MDIAVSAIIPISLDHLIVSAHNARTIDREPIDDLAASIAAEGLLQNLTVIEGDAGIYEVIAGKRRFGALRLLRDRGQLPPAAKTAPKSRGKPVKKKPAAPAKSKSKAAKAKPVAKKAAAKKAGKRT